MSWQVLVLVSFANMLGNSHVACQGVEGHNNGVSGSKSLE